MKKRIIAVSLALFLAIALMPHDSSYAAPLWEREPNDTWETANSLPVNTDIIGNLSSGRDRDFFVVELAHPGTFQVRFTFVHHDHWAPQSFNVAVLEREGDNLRTLQSTLFNRGTLTANRLRLPAGTYYVRISGGNVGEHTDNDYTLHILHTPEVSHTITVTASPANGGTVTGGGTFQEGASVTLQATPSAGWSFEGWFEGNARVNTNATITFDATANRSFEARFTIIPFSNPHSVWAREELTRAFEAGLVPLSLTGAGTDLRSSTTRAEYCALAVTLYESFRGEITGRVTFADTNDVNVQKMAYIGVVQGVGGNRFDPNAPLTRAQAATMLSRLANALGQPLPATRATFADNGDIPSWAFEGVGQVQAAGIMTGVGGNRFAPGDPYTREQSIITMIRLFNIVS